MIEKVSWSEFLNRFRWEQSEHIGLIAPSGAGKTTIIDQIKDKREWNIIFGTKPKDSLYSKFIRDGYRRVESINEVKSYDKKILLWPKYGNRPIPEIMKTQRDAFREALDKIVHQGGWTLWIDEAKYCSQNLRLSTEINFCVNQLRSNEQSVICGAQRPAWIPPDVLANATHVFLWKSNNRDDQIKLADIGGIDSKLVRDEAKSLGDHEFIYIKTRGTNSQMVISQAKL